MSFSGNVSSMSLEEVFGFLSGNALRGVLSVQSGDDVTLRLYFDEGRIFFPFAAKRGTYQLGKILRHTGVLSRQGLAAYLEDQSAQRKRLLGGEGGSAGDPPEVQAARRQTLTEEVHDLFLWGDARFEFRPGDWPPRVEADREAGRGLVLETTSLLMEAARRADETRRIRRSVPSSRVVLCTVDEGDDAVVARLAASKIEVSASPFDGTLSLDDLLERWGIPHHEALGAVAELVEAGRLVSVPPDETRAKLRELLEEGGDLVPAARLLAHWAELQASRGEPLSLDLEQEFVTSPAFSQGPEESTSLRLPGSRVFTLLRVLTTLGQPFTVVLHHRGWEKRIAALPGEVFVRNERRADRATPETWEYLVKARALTKEQGAALRGADAAALTEAAGAEAVAKAQLERLVDELAEVVFWGRSEVELTNRSKRGTSAADGLTVRLDEAGREALLDGLGRWGDVFERVSGDECVFVPGYGATKRGAKDPAARFFRRFSLERNVGELRRKAGATRLEFVQFVARGLDRGYIRAPTREELREGIDAARAAKNDVACFRLATAAVAQGLGEAFESVLEELRQAEAALPVPFPALEGDLDGVGLGALLQALQQHRRTGTLVVRAGRREEKLHFSRGEAFILTVDEGDDDFVAFFLGDEGADSVNELGSGLASRGLVEESDLSEAEVAELKASFLDLLLWDGSTFSFFQNQLPEEFFAPGEKASKVHLHTQRFLMEAMQQVTEYEACVAVIGGGRTVYAFAAPARKLEAIQALGHPEILTLVDGRLTFDDLVRISGAQRLDVARVLRGLVEDEALVRVGEGTDPDDAIPDAIPDPKPEAEPEVERADDGREPGDPDGSSGPDGA
jgi:hypothetical protein